MLGDLIKTVTEGLGKVFGFVDDLHTSDEEKLTLKQGLLTIQAGILSQAIALEEASLKAKSAIIEAEAKSDHWLTATWRPITALAFAAIVCYSFIFNKTIPGEMWTTLNIMIGGYVGSRGAEKIIPGVMKALKGKEEA
jgi:hypothetical protein